MDIHFDHVQTPVIKRPLKRLDTTDGHFYEHESGRIYPSITTVLRILTRDGIQAWRSHVGPAYADRISKESTEAGTKMHEFIEKFLKNESLPTDYKKEDYAIDPKTLFENIKPALANINNIVAQEIPLYSEELEIAGTADCIAEYNNVLSIIDFKNSRKPKTKSKVMNYFIQLTGYAEMWRYCTGQKIEQGVVIIANWDGTCNAFTTRVDNHLSQLWETLIMYEKDQYQA